MNKDKSDKSDICVETSKEVRADTNKELVSERISACSFEDQFKNWIKKGNVNSETERNENTDCQNSHIFAGHSVESDKECQETENKKNASGKDSSTEMENCEENMPTDSFQATASQPGGDIFVTKESSQKDSGLQPCDQVSLTSPVLCTQPFEICLYPQTQEFVPKLSETLVQTPLLESLTACNNESLSKSNISKDSDIPQTQEFLPQLSESLIQTSMLESLTCPNESVNDRSTSKDSDKTSRTPFHVECNSLKEGQIETTNELEKDLTKYDLGETKKSYTSMRKSSPEKVKKLGDKQVTVPFHLGQAHKKNTGDEKENIVHSGSSVTNKTSLNDHFEHTGNSIIEATFDATLGATRETRCVSSTEDKTFTKLMKKCEPQYVSSDFWAISKPEKLAFKVKPVKRTNIHRKRKSDFNSLDNTSKIKKQKCTDSVEEYSKVVKERNETKVGLKQNNKVAESVVDTLNDSLEDFVVNKSPKKAKTSTKAVHEETVVVGDRENKTKSTDGVKTPCKTYEPRKIFIDGHCFGNKVFWQNFIESPYSAPASGETKNKSFVEKTNKRKSRLDSSQGSQKKSSSSTVGENVEKIEHAAVNRSSESLFSGENEENEIHDLSPDSLLPRKKIETGVSDIVKTYADQTKLKKCVKIVNESGTKSKSNSGDLIYSRVNGMLRFYRQKDAEHEENKDSDSGALADPQLGRYKRRNAKLDNNTDRKVFDPVCETSKQINSVNKQKERVEKSEGNKIPSLDMKGSVFNEMFSIDKKLFVHDWLMKHKKIGEQESSSQELSPPEIQTPGNSLPSYQPTVSAVGQQAQNYVTDREQSFVLHEVSAKEQQKRENSLDDTSSSESSGSIRSEDLKKPMPAAARYLLKFRKARRERKRKKMLEFKSNMKNTV
ncbi:uncharacterized protein LOC123548552 [Mercenaria mercenaria]|uniref:uncharacterized protein LOC123548552 n=1 Tax=Mercenaria mercenaria TaxID=6596 RepID=UPI00234F3189|nr:uncharacterized protein LOC123548552 [Mercenaria mercenaria]